MPVTDETFRTLVDPSGRLLPGALAAPPLRDCFTVFAQRSDARVELSTWERHASQFFGARLGLVVPRAASAPAQDTDAALVVLAPPDAPGASRLVYGRRRDDEELDLADRADVAQGSPGLGALARRCEYVWLVETEPGAGGRDRHALLLAAILASVVLGPILAPDGRDLFGVRTARTRLEEAGAPYR